MNLPFSHKALRDAILGWGCNCGPAALSFAIQKPIELMRAAIPDFDSKRYTSPSMMKSALAHFQRDFEDIRLMPPKPGEFPDVIGMFHERPALTRIQWTGPWTKTVASVKWACGQSHWIASWSENTVPFVFDINSGIVTYPTWENTVVPAITQRIPRADGGFYPTHVWRLR